MQSRTFVFGLLLHPDVPTIYEEPVPDKWYFPGDGLSRLCQVGLPAIAKIYDLEVEVPHFLWWEVEKICV